MSVTVNVIGAGLAGCEAAYQIAERGVSVRLYEMKPHRKSPAHKSDGFAELVCSNSLRSGELTNAVGLLKEEMRRLGSLVMQAADETRVPAGGALAVDRDLFSSYITDRIRRHPNITVVEEEITSLPRDELTVCASGPLTDGALAADISALLGGDTLHFFDAAAPIVSADSIDLDVSFFASRYGKGDKLDYLNCPMTREQYDRFYEALVHAEEAPLKDFDKEAQSLTVFEGCMPVEVMAKRGYDTLRFGPMKPVGIELPTGGEAYAIVQLRRENREGTMYNLVGFQTHLTFGEQRRVFSMIPGLENAEFLRYGVMHRNTYMNSPGRLSPTYRLLSSPNLYFAGQMTGVEGYVESASSGLVAGIAASRVARGMSEPCFPCETVIGALAHYVSEGESRNFQPMNANFGIVAPFDCKIKGGKRMYKIAYGERSLARIEAEKNQLLP